MLTTASIIALLKTQSGLAALGVAVINLISAERMRQYELARELGTLACDIENAKVTRQPHSHLQAKYDVLARKRR